MGTEHRAEERRDVSKRRGIADRLRPASVRRGERRRSLLKVRRDVDPELPSLWRLLLTSYGTALLLYLVWTLLNLLFVSGSFEIGEALPMFLSTSLFIALFILPIILLGYLGTRLHIRWYGKAVTPSLRLGRMGIWLSAGVVGSLIGYEFLYLFIIGDIGFNNHSLAVTLAANVVVVLLVSLAGAAVSMGRRGRQLHRQTELLTSEFQAAYRMQQSLLPEKDLRLLGFDISGGMTPAVEVGGDYYDYLTFADGKKGILVADAAGKGIPAALIMAKFQGMAQALSIYLDDPSEFFIGLNDTLRIRLDRQSFITVGMVTIDLEDRCAFWRAGHNPLLHFRQRDGLVQEIRPSGLALGLTEGGGLGNSLHPEEFTMEPGDILLLYSDGLVEAENGGGEMFGEERLCGHLQQIGVRSESAGSIRTFLLEQLQEFVGDADEHDDVTLVVIRRIEVSGEG